MMPLEAVADHCSETDVWDVSDFPVLEYPRNRIVKIGEMLAGDIEWDEGEREKVFAIFRIAYNWRAAHLFPMRILRYELRRLADSACEKNVVVAARLKRMVSIRKKLRRTSNTLRQMQDLGGCRAILRNHDDLQLLLARYRYGNSKHKFKREWDYIGTPKDDGYRSHHLLFSFNHRKPSEEPFSGLNIELQLRTRWQHAWATAVEAIGLATNQDFKGGEGDADWRRLFALMSTEIAIREGFPIVPNTPSKKHERNDEIRELNKKLGATQMLKNINVGLHAMPPKGSYSYFLIQFVKDKVSFQGFNIAASGAEDFNIFERTNPAAVLVQVDRAEDLKRAYPNYFLDVRAFAWLLKRATDAISEIEFKQGLGSIWP